MFDTRELFWAAGFLEGEGCFTAGKFGQQYAICKIQAPQVNPEPLERLQKLFGGTIAPVKDNRPGSSSIQVWRVTGSTAASVMMTLWTLLSQKRRDEISGVLSRWKDGKRPPLRHAKQCPKGHSLATYGHTTPNGDMVCRECKRMYNSEYYAEHKYDDPDAKRAYAREYQKKRYWKMKALWEVKQPLNSET